MNWKKITGFVFLFCGVSALIFGFYIQNRVDQGKAIISLAQKSVNKSKSLFLLAPVTGELGINKAAQSKIDEGNLEVRHYENIAHAIEIGGALAIVFGVAILALYRRKHHHL